MGLTWENNWKSHSHSHPLQVKSWKSFRPATFLLSLHTAIGGFSPGEKQKFGNFRNELGGNLHWLERIPNIPNYATGHSVLPAHKRFGMLGIQEKSARLQPIMACSKRHIKTIDCEMLQQKFSNLNWQHILSRGFRIFLNILNCQVPLCYVWRFHTTWSSNPLGLNLSLQYLGGTGGPRSWASFPRRWRVGFLW